MSTERNCSIARITITIAVWLEAIVVVLLVVAMTSPAEKIRVRCPRCGNEYDDWHRSSINLDIDDFDDDYVRQATTTTCAECGFIVELDSLIVEDGIWKWYR